MYDVCTHLGRDATLVKKQNLHVLLLIIIILS